MCLKHSAQIKDTLKIGGVRTQESYWSSAASNKDRGAQIDLVIDTSRSMYQPLRNQIQYRTLYRYKAVCGRTREKEASISGDNQNEEGTVCNTYYALRRRGKPTLLEYCRYASYYR